MRAFLGIALAGPVVTTLEQTSEAIRATAPAWRAEKWVPPQNLHITVRFLGDVSDAVAPALMTVLTEVVSQHATHDIELAGVAARPRTRSANMVWATFDGEVDATRALVQALSDALHSAGYGRPEHPFAPHATLVRARRPKTIGLDALDAARRVIDGASVRDRAMSVTQVTLFSSTLTPQGPRYRVMGTAGLIRD